MRVIFVGKNLIGKNRRTGLRVFRKTRIRRKSRVFRKRAKKWWRTRIRHWTSSRVRSRILRKRVTSNSCESTPPNWRTNACMRRQRPRPTNTKVISTLINMSCIICRKWVRRRQNSLKDRKTRRCTWKYAKDAKPADLNRQSISTPNQHSAQQMTNGTGIYNRPSSVFPHTRSGNKGVLWLIGKLMKVFRIVVRIWWAWCRLVGKSMRKTRKLIIRGNRRLT